MPGVWPNLDAADMESRVRTYINEVTPSFFTQAEIYRWLSWAMKDVAQKTLCVQRIINARTANATRNVATDTYKVLHVEYLPTGDRPVMLAKIDPLKVGRIALNGTAPQFWYEIGNNIGIEPIPDGVYSLRLYCADYPHLQQTTTQYPIANFTANPTWASSGTGTWTNGAASAVYAGTSGQTATDTATGVLTAGVSHLFMFTLSGVSNCGMTISAGTTASPTFNTAGYHCVKLIPATNTNVVMTASMTGASGGLTVTNLFIAREDNISAGSDQVTFPAAYQHLVILGATAKALHKDKRIQAANMLEDIYNKELEYLRSTLVDIPPDGREHIKYN